MDKKTKSINVLPPRDPSPMERYTQTKSKRMEKDISFKWNEKKSWGRLLISDKRDFKTKPTVRDRER